MRLGFAFAHHSLLLHSSWVECDWEPWPVLPYLTCTPSCPRTNTASLVQAQCPCVTVVFWDLALACASWRESGDRTPLVTTTFRFRPLCHHPCTMCLKEPDFSPQQVYTLPQNPRPIVSIGLGGIVHDAHFPAYKIAGFQVVGGYDVDPVRAKMMQDKFAIPVLYSTVEEAVSQAPADAVFDLAVPGSAIMGILQQLKPGSTVLIQKPMGEDLMHARAIRSLCHEKGFKVTPSTFAKTELCSRWHDSNQHPQNPICTPYSRKNWASHGRPENGTTKFHGSKSCDSNTSCWSDMGVGLGRGGRGAGAHQEQTSREGEKDIWWTARTARGGTGHLGLTHTEPQRGRLWTACGQRRVDGKNSQTTPATTSTSSIRQLLGAADAQTAHHATFSTAPTHQLLGSANAETTPAAAADRKQQPDANMRREERVTVQGPVKEQQPDGMAHRGGTRQIAVCRHVWLSRHAGHGPGTEYVPMLVSPRRACKQHPCQNHRRCCSHSVLLPLFLQGGEGQDTLEWKENMMSH